jgi:hypothetical protein
VPSTRIARSRSSERLSDNCRIRIT